MSFCVCRCFFYGSKTNVRKFAANSAPAFNFSVDFSDPFKEGLRNISMKDLMTFGGEKFARSLILAVGLGRKKVRNSLDWSESSVIVIDWKEIGVKLEKNTWFDFSLYYKHQGQFLKIFV